MFVGWNSGCASFEVKFPFRTLERFKKQGVVQRNWTGERNDFMETVRSLTENFEKQVQLRGGMRHPPVSEATRSHEGAVSKEYPEEIDRETLGIAYLISTTASPENQSCRSV